MANPSNYYLAVQSSADDLRLSASLFTLLAGEDLPNDVIKVENRFSYNNLTTSSPTTIKSGAGFVHKILFNQPFPNILKVYDNTAGSGTLIGTISGGLAISACTMWEPNVSFTTGLTISATSGTPDITVSYR